MNRTAPPAEPPGLTAPPLDPDMTAQQLLRRSRRLWWMSLLPLLGLVLVLAAWQAWAQWRLALESAVAEARDHRVAFDVIVRDASHHVADLRHWMQQEFLRHDGEIAPAVAAALQPRRNAQGRDDGHSLDGLSPLLANGMAQLMWPRGQGRPGAPVLRQAQTLSAAIELAHQRSQHLVWSTYFGWPDRHVVLFPWVPSRSVAEDQGAADMSAALEAWYRQEVVSACTPEANPLRQPVWTAPTIDSGGAGLLVTHALPVYSADEWRGVVATDIRLSALERLLDALPGAPWRAWIVDERGHVLADRQRPVATAEAASAAGTASPAGGLVRAVDRLPAGVDPIRLVRDVEGHAPTETVAGHRVVALRIAGAPWVLVLAAPVWALAGATLPQVLPYTAIALGLLLVWLVGQGLMRQRLLTPVLELLGYLHRLSDDPQAPEPRLGERWRPWVRRVRHAFDEMREAARRERRADSLKSAIVDHAQAAVVMSDAAGRIVEFNPSAQAMLGWSRDAVIGQTVQELLTPAHERAALEHTLAAMRRGEAGHLMGRRIRGTCLRADGHELPVEMVLWMTEVEGVAYFTASMTDQTAAIAAAEVIERQRDALRQSEKLSAMGGLLAGVAHELNNPLAIVMGRATLLQEKTEGTALAADAARIRDAAERCGRIVRTFLNMARQRPAQHGPVRLNDLVRGAADMLGYTLRSHGIELELRLHEPLPEPLADGDQIGQVVLNLIVNAQQALTTHTGARRIALTSGCDPSGQRPGPAARVWLRVTDSGPGVPEALREKVFEPFFTTKAEGLGTGIGLSVSRGIVREHGGDLLLEPPMAGRGASFLLVLPLEGSTASAGADPSPAAGDDALAAGTAPAPEAARVLVVDDEADVADLVRTVLEGAGHEVATADSGQVALAMLEAARFDAIVSDLRMPDMDGAGLWRAIREHHPALARRVLFLTGDTLSAGTRQFLDETGCLRLDKPFTRDDLLTLVGRTLHTPV